LDRGIDEQAVLVDEPSLDQGVTQRDAAGDHNVLALLFFQRTDTWHRVSAKDRGVLPLGIGDRGRNDVLAHLVQIFGDTCRILTLPRPVAAQVFEGLAAGKECVTPAVLAMQLLDEISLITLALGVEPVSEHLDRTVDGHVLRNDQRAHRYSFDWDAISTVCGRLGYSESFVGLRVARSKTLHRDRLTSVSRDHFGRRQTRDKRKRRPPPPSGDRHPLSD